MPVLDRACVQKMEHHALARPHPDRFARPQRFVVDRIQIGRYLKPRRPRIQHRRLLRFRARGVEIVGIHVLRREVRLPVAQRQVMLLIVVARVGPAFHDQKSELSGECPPVQIVHRHRVRVVPARTRGRRRELVAAAAMWRHRRRTFLFGTVHVGRNQQPVKMDILGRIGLVDHVDRHRRAFLHPQQRSRRHAVVPDRAHDAVGRKFHRDRRDLEVEYRSRKLFGARSRGLHRPRHRRRHLRLLPRQWSGGRRRSGQFQEIAAIDGGWARHRKGLAGTFVPRAVRGTLQDNKGGYGP